MWCDEPVSTPPSPGSATPAPATDAEPSDEQLSTASGGATLFQGLLLAAIVGYVWRFGGDLANLAAESLDACDAATSGIACLTGPGIWQYALWPLVSLIGAFSLYRGAMVANARGKGHGAVLTLAGFGVLGASLAGAYLP